MLDCGKIGRTLTSCNFPNTALLLVASDRRPMPLSSCLLALLSLSAADALCCGGGAMTGGSRAALKSGAQSQRTQPVTPRSAVVLHAAAAVLALAPPAPHTSRVGLDGSAKRPQQVSNLGRVRTVFGIITEGYEASSGYRSVGMHNKTYYVHRLVASQADFVPPPLSDKHTEVNHKDLDPANNRADNLEWVTHSENMRHSFDTNPDRKSNAPKQSKPVLGRRYGSEDEWVEYESVGAAARELGVDRSSIFKCCRGKRKRAGEYEFKLAPLAEDQHDRPREEWREVQLDCGASRRVSNLGRVRSAHGIITEGSEHPSGYMRASINGKSHRVHRLVAQAFLPLPPSEKHTQVNHKDLDPANNHADNLEWVTPAENIRHSFDTNAERKSSAPKLSKPVLGRKHGSEGEWVEYESGSAAAQELGLDSASISRCCRGKVKRASEYEFKLVPLTEDQHDRPGEVWRDVTLDSGSVIETHMAAPAIHSFRRVITR
eukprot:scaffold23972_cov60-Phaeocystis_antarctica.AAC.3